MPKRKLPKVFSKKELALKDTRSLLGYLKRLQHCEASFEKSDLDENLDLKTIDIIYFKNTDKWKVAYQNVKSILKNREHIDNKA